MAGFIKKKYQGNTKWTKTTSRAAGKGKQIGHTPNLARWKGGSRATPKIDTVGHQATGCSSSAVRSGMTTLY